MLSNAYCLLLTVQLLLVSVCSVAVYHGMRSFTICWIMCQIVWMMQRISRFFHCLTCSTVFSSSSLVNQCRWLMSVLTRLATFAACDIGSVWKCLNVADRVGSGQKGNGQKRSAIPHEECRWGAHLPSWGHEPIGRLTTEVCDAGECDVRPTVTFPAAGHHHPLTGTRWYCLMTEAHVWRTCPSLLPESGMAKIRTHYLLSCKSDALTIMPPSHMDKRKT